MLYIIASLILILIFYFLKYVNITFNGNKEKFTIYECGFNEFDQPRQKYYLKFYIIAILFLIFDLETILLYPLSINISSLSNSSFLFFFYFLFIISIGLAIELKNKILD